VTGDFTSPPLRETDPWTGARLQQGRVLLDGDWNLNVDASARERRQLALDAIGPAGVPQGGTGFQIGFAADGTLQIGAGSMWVSGLRAVNPATIAYSAQEGIGALPADGQALIYLDAFVQEVQPAEDPGDLLDPALDGIDTTARTRVAWRARAALLSPGAAASCADAAVALPSELISSGLLDIAATTPASPADPCAPPGDPRGKLPDGLLRVEVLDSGTEQTARFAWSYENGSAAVAATVAGATVTLAPSPSVTFYVDDLVEVSTLQRRADRVDNGPLFTVASVNPGAGGSVVTLSSPSMVTGAPSGLCLRRWDGQVTGAAQAVPATLAGADVGVTFTAQAGNYLAGDWWVTRVRGSSSGAVDALTAAPPDGTGHYVASLAVVDLAAKTVLNDCRPTYLPLTSITGGCCTVEVQPSDVSGGATLPALLSGIADQGPTTVCLAPGTYTLTAPLILGSAFSGLTLQGCDKGVVLQGPSAPGPEFTLGLIVIEGATDVVLRDIELSVPLVGFTPPSGAFGSLSPNNQALLEAYASGLEVGFGVYASDVTGLRVEDCAFSFPDPGAANTFAAGVYATGAMTGMELTRCTFESVNPPNTTPFYDLTAGNQTQPPYQITIGYLQVANYPQSGGSGLAGGPASQSLHDATVERCVFQGLSAAVFAFTELGTVHIGQNTIRDCYGGCWLYSVNGPSGFALLNRIAIGDPKFFVDLSSSGLVAIAERIAPVTLALTAVLPVTPPAAGGAVAARRVAEPGEEELARARQRFETLFSQARESGPAPAAGPGEAGPAPAPGRPGSEEELLRLVDVFIPVGPGLVIPPIPVAETGTGVITRVDLRDCQLDAIVAQSYSGAALILIDFTESGSASAIVHGNRLRSRFPGGQAALTIWLAEASVTGNIIANEAAIPVTATSSLLNSYSLCMLVPLTPLGPGLITWSISGNVFIDPPLNAAQREQWGLLNTTVNYSAVPIVTGISPPGGGTAGGTSVTIVGTGFTAATSVNFGSVNIAVPPATVTSDFEIAVTSPQGTGVVDVTVTTPAGTSATSQADQFTYS
jgi:hypothetical protein